LFRGAWSELDADALTTYAASRTAGDSIEFTASITHPGDHRIRVIHLADSRPFLVALNDGEPELVATIGGSDPVATEIKLPALAAGVHRVTVTVAGDAGVLQVGSIGIEAAAGIVVGDFGISMSTTEDWVAEGAPYSALRHVVAWAPDLALIALMTNDAHGLAVPPDRYAANLRAMVDALAETCDVVLEVQIPGEPSLVDLAPYREAVYAVADATGVPVLDLYDRWGNFAAARDAGLMNDMFHPNATGAADIAAAELAVVTA
jgi:lysophospholipase L1-like esterase